MSFRPIYHHHHKDKKSKAKEEIAQQNKKLEEITAWGLEHIWIWKWTPFLIFLSDQKNVFLDPIQFSNGTKISHLAGWKTRDDRISVYNVNRDHLFKGAEN